MVTETWAGATGVAIQIAPETNSGNASSFNERIGFPFLELSAKEGVVPHPDATQAGIF